MLRPEVATARKLRREMTFPEALLWQQLRGSNTGSKFRRQHPVGPYVADFCIAGRLIVEVDGETHGRGSRPAYDTLRDTFLQDNGYRVLRIAAADILRDLDVVTTAIVAHAARPLHHSASPSGPPPRTGKE